MQFSKNRKPVSDFVSAIAAKQKEPVFYIANPGNAGDAVIALGTYHLFERAGLNYQILRADNLPELSGKTIFFGGGGNLIQGRYADLYNAIVRYVDTNRCIVLPHTIWGYEDLIRRCRSGNLTVFCREETSYNLCVMENELDNSNIYLDDDLAFSIDDKFLSSFRETKGVGTANCFRTDSESSGLHPVPEGNRDISYSWNGSLWHDRNLTESVVESLLIYISRFESIRTDRLHVAILGTLIGRTTYLFPNAYYKNRSVFEMSLKRFANAYFINTSTDLLHSEYIQYLLDKNGIAA